MLRGTIAAASGMMAQMARQDVIANNLANATSAGFRRDDVTTASFGQYLLARYEQGRLPRQVGTIPTGIIGSVGHVDLTPGTVRDTGMMTDLAIDGEGFFAVEAPEAPGGVLLTRDGHFHVDEGGYLAARDGRRVLGEGGPIRVGGESFSVTQDGRILVPAVDAVPQAGLSASSSIESGQWAEAGRILVLTVGAGPGTGPAEAIEKAGSGYLALRQGAFLANAGDFRVVQGSLEGSNVTVVKEMVSMIQAFRAYEACQKVIQAQDQTLGRAVNDLAGRM